MFKTRTLLATACVAALASANAANATTFAGQDFDGNNGGAYAGPVTEVFTPDNSGNFTTFTPSAPGTFNNNYDIFGITNRNVGYDFADDTLNGFTGDTFGFAGVGADDPGNFVGFEDTINPNNAGPVTAVWTFDVSGKTDLAVAMDFVAYGDFEDSDFILVTASVDGSTPQTIFDVSLTPAQDTADITYPLIMDDGSVEDVYFSPFYDSATWDNLIANGPTATITYHPLDDGTNGDTVANDGFIPAPTYSNPTNETRAYSDLSSGFDEQQIEPLKDPLTEQNSGTQLNNVLQTITSSITPTGSTLTLTLVASFNGNGEIAALDNIQICDDGSCGSTVAIPGDLNGDGYVGLDDLQPILDHWNQNVTVGDPSMGDIAGPGGTGPDGYVGLDDLQPVLDHWNEGTLPTPSSIPEPASLALFTIAGLSTLTRRRNRA